MVTPPLLFALVWTKGMVGHAWLVWPAGLFIFGLGMLGRVWAQQHLHFRLRDVDNAFTHTGPYRWVRNPMAVAGIVQGIGVGMVLSSWLVVAYAVVGSVVWNAAVRPLEEADLAARFGDDFARYRAAVRCWLPTIPARTSAR